MLICVEGKVSKTPRGEGHFHLLEGRCDILTEYWGEGGVSITFLYVPPSFWVFLKLLVIVTDLCRLRWVQM